MRCSLLNRSCDGQIPRLRDAPIVSAIFQAIGIGTLKFSPIFADTNTFIFLIENTNNKYWRPNMKINGYFVILFFLFILFSYHLYKCYKLYTIYGKLNPALQVLEPCFTSPSLRFSINWYRRRPSKKYEYRSLFLYCFISTRAGLLLVNYLFTVILLPNYFNSGVLSPSHFPAALIIGKVASFLSLV